VVSGIAALSVIAAMLFTANRIGTGGLWSGLYVHKNLLGRVLALGVAGSGVMMASRYRRRAALGALLICGGVLVVSQSVASILAAVIALAVTVVLAAARAYRSAAPAILVTGAVATTAAVLSLIGTKPGLRLMARSETFSDRTRIWQVVAAGAEEDPWFGHGYGAFWTGPAGERALAVIQLPINHAHNGAIDLYAELGIAGLVVVIVPVAWAALAAVRHALQPKPTACLWPATYIVFFIASNAAESGLLRHKLYWALFVAVLCHLVRHRSAHGVTRPPQRGASAAAAARPTARGD
jgi:O-antigen ligase